jgi:hypothetical protein
MRKRLPSRTRFAAFAVLVLVAEVVGRSLTARIDRALHVDPLAPATANYYPFLLVGVKIIGALALAGLFARAMRVHTAARAGRRLLAALGHRQERSPPRLRPGPSPRVWLASFAATSTVYLVHADLESVAAGRWPLLAPWLHTYSLPVFAVLSVLAALAWRLAGWLREVEEYAEHTFARVRRLITRALRARAARWPRVRDDADPRTRFGLAFESRPPPVAA